jgi:hypothetical protein
MQFAIGWSFYVRAHDQQSASRLTNQPFAEIHDLTVLHRLEQYWKDPELFEATAETFVQAASFADAIVQTLLLAGNIGERSVVSAPSIGDNQFFSGAILDEHITAPGIQTLSFHLGNVRPVDC